MYKKFHQQGYRVFGLYHFSESVCACDSPNCTAAGKHPINSGWQYSPVWSDEQLQTLEDMGHFESGYGVLCGNGLLVVDIDPRNGGAMDFCIDEETLIVSTGGGGLHIYFTIPEGVVLASHLEQYPGIDFKSSGFIVGPGSNHVSGQTYKVHRNQPIAPAPQWLLDLLDRPEFVRVELDSGMCDYTREEIEQMLEHIDPDCSYDEWIRVGMALHSAGLPFEVWRDWSSKGTKFVPSNIHNHWKSFSGQGAVQLGTLIYMAQAGGYSLPVSFAQDTPAVLPVIEDVDLLRPPGLVGEVAAWIESNNRRSRENLAVASALYAVGSLIGLKYTDDKDNVSTNLFMCCVAGSGTGKEAPQTCISEIFSAAGIAKAKASGVKSEQEILRNLTVRGQASFLVLDELGLILGKIKNAQRTGSASYLEGIPGILMSAHGKANGVLGVSGDMYDYLLSEFGRLLAAENKKQDENESFSQTTINNLETLINNLQHDGGIRNPFLSMIGFTTRTHFDETVTYSTATDGFLRRAFIIIEGDDAPPMKPDFTGAEMPLPLKIKLAGLYSQKDLHERVQYNGKKVKVPTTPEAKALLEQATKELDALARECEDGMESLYIGAYENISKVSLILAAGGGLRTVEHVRWAYALTLRDIRFKRSLVKSNDDLDKGSALVEKIRHFLEVAAEDGLTVGRLYNRLRKYKRSDVDSALEWLVEKREICAAHGLKTSTYYISKVYKKP